MSFWWWWILSPNIAILSHFDTPTRLHLCPRHSDNVVKLHGVPLSIISDRDRVFTSAFWQELIKVVGTKLSYSTAYHPQTDDQSKKVNKCLEQYLRCAVQDNPKTWRRWLPMAEFWYSTSYHTAIGCTPFKTLYRTEPNFAVYPTLQWMKVKWL